MKTLLSKSMELLEEFCHEQTVPISNAWEDVSNRIAELEDKLKSAEDRQVMTMGFLQSVMMGRAEARGILDDIVKAAKAEQERDDG